MKNISIDTIIGKLNDSLMFNLSLSSKELFHSNLLSYLFSKYNNLLCQIIQEDDFSFDIKREHKNIDIEILGNNNKKYIIENKVKDILQQEQYDEISSLYIKDKYERVYLFSLLGNNLSLISDNYNWKEIKYSDITECLRRYNFNDNYISLIVKDYCNFIDDMVTILESALLNCNNYIFHYENNILHKLRKIRIHDVFLKYGMSLFVNYFKKLYSDIFIDFGINRGMGTMSFYRLINDIHIGIQIENLQYRKYSVCDIQTRNLLENNGWFDKNYKSPGNKQYLTYSTKDRDKTFYYQLHDRNIKDMEFKELSEIIMTDLFCLI